MKNTTLKATRMRRSGQTPRGYYYECETNIEGVEICNDGYGGETYLQGKWSDIEPFEHLTEFDLEDLVDEMESN